MRSTLLHDRPDRNSVLWLIAAFTVVSLIALPLAMWFGPVSLPFLAASALIGFLSILLIFAFTIYRAHRWARALWLLAILVISIGPNILSTTLFSLPLRHYFFWPIFFQGLASIFIMFGLTLAFEERLVSLRRGLLIGIVLIGVGFLSWFRAEQSQPLVYPASSNITVQDDAPPGARKTTFVTTATPSDILTFYRERLERWGWQFTCSADVPSCRSEITEGLNAPHDIYHLRSDASQRGPTYEIIIRASATGETIVEVYDQTRGVPNQLPWQ